MDVIDLNAVRQFFSRWHGEFSIEQIRGICCDSRCVRPGDVFVAVRGVEADGHNFVKEAVNHGASIVIVEKELSLPEEVVQIQVENSALVLGELAQKKFHQTLLLWGYKGFFVRPISLCLLIVTIAMLVIPYWRDYLKSRKAS